MIRKIYFLIGCYIIILSILLNIYGIYSTKNISFFINTYDKSYLINAGLFDVYIENKNCSYIYEEFIKIYRNKYLLILQNNSVLSNFYIIIGLLLSVSYYKHDKYNKNKINIFLLIIGSLISYINIILFGIIIKYYKNINIHIKNEKYYISNIYFNFWFKTVLITSTLAQIGALFISMSEKKQKIIKSKLNTDKYYYDKIYK